MVNGKSEKAGDGASVATRELRARAEGLMKLQVRPGLAAKRKCIDGQRGRSFLLTSLSENTRCTRVFLRAAHAQRGMKLLDIGRVGSQDVTGRAGRVRPLPDWC